MSILVGTNRRFQPQHFATSQLFLKHLPARISFNYLSLGFISSIENIKEKIMSQSKALYEELDPAASQIRLVTIKPGEWADDIKCTLQTTSLNGHGPYEALSYVWGDPKITKGITLNGRPFQVTTNLESALRHLRLRGPRTMWIDAMCINQLDIKERGSQVRYMRNIYQQGTMTVIWLGDETLKSKSAFELIGKSTDRDKREDNVKKLATLIKDEPSAYRSLEYLDSDIGTRPWWMRAWVVQEAALSKDLAFHCGSDEIPWSKFAEFAATITEGMGRSSISGDIPGLAIVGVIGEIMEMREFSKTGRLLPLPQLVSWHRFKHATDSRDRVYSLLSLSMGVQDPSLNPDYSASNQRVDVFRHLVEYSVTNQSLDIICMSRGTTQTCWPSWIPDWDAHAIDSLDRGEELEFINADTLITSFNKPTHGLGNEGPSPDLIFSDYSASLSIVPKCSFIHELPTLIAAGICVDTIQTLSKTCRPYEAEWAFGRIDLWETLIWLHFNGSRSLHTNEKGYSVAEVTKQRHRIGKHANWVNSLFQKPRKDNGFLSLFWSLWRSVLLALRRLRDPIRDVGYVSGGTVAEAYLRTLMTDRWMAGHRLNDENIKSFWSNDVILWDSYNLGIGENTAFRRLMISSKGYIGLAPPKAQEGDLICVLFGCSVPVIIRKVKDHHIFIGESYVHGIMDGEAIDQMNEGTLTEEEFILR
jgi:hypothetical protein